MRIVIDIPQTAYEVMKINVETGKPLCPISEKEIVTAIASGTPLLDGAKILTKEEYSDLCLRTSKVDRGNEE